MKGYSASSGTVKAAAHEEWLKEGMRLIKFVAGRLATRLPAHVHVDDLYGVGAIGLLDAIEKFDPSRGNKFSTYAEFRIRGAMMDELRSSDWMSRNARRKAQQLSQVIHQLQSKFGREPTEREIADALQLSMDAYAELLTEVRGLQPISFEEIGHHVNIAGDRILDLMEDPTALSPAVQLDSQELIDRLTAAIGDLPEKQKYLVSLYYFDELNFRQIAEVLGVTEGRISQLHTQAMATLRAKLGDDFLESL